MAGGVPPVACSLALDARPAPGVPVTPGHYDRVVALVQAAEALGYRSVWASEQHGVDDGYLPAPLILLSALARETATIRLGTGAVILALAQPRRVAEEAAVVDQLSGGRLSLAFGAGHHPHEFEAFGRRLEDRGPLMEHGLRFVREALREPVAPDGLPLNVRPVQPCVPVLGGGLARPAIDRAVRMADGHFAYTMVDPDAAMGELYEGRIRPALEHHERPAGSFRLVVSAVVWASEDADREWAEHVGPAFRFQQEQYLRWAGASVDELPAFLRRERWDLGEVRQRMLVGSPREVAERLVAARSRYPFDELVLVPALPGVPFELVERMLRTFAAEVAPALAAPVRA